jgi:hypothetical protein
MSDDVLPSVLSIRYLASIMGGRRGMVFGAYPGIELRREGSSVVDAEVDVLAVLRTGGLIVGECKTNARGLTSGELDKLWTAADQVNARATFAATLDSARDCGPLWRLQAAPNGRPHFALTAEHLFDLQIRGSGINGDLFEWRDDHPVPRGQDEPPASAPIDDAFNRFAEGTSTDHQQLRRAPWMTPGFIDSTLPRPASSSTAATML